MSIVLTKFPIELNNSYKYTGKENPNGCITYNGFKVTSQFGGRTLEDGNSNPHYGIDLSVAKGSKVYAAHSGVIKEALTGFKQFSKAEREANPDAFKAAGLGNRIAVEDTKNNFYTMYAHLSELYVGIGDTVEAGQLIGLSGSTGYSFAPHLHFETVDCLYDKRNHKYNRNPLYFLNNVANGLNGYSAANIANKNVESWDLSEYDIVGEGKTGPELFGRKYRIIVYNNNGEISDVSDLRVVFKCNKSWTMDSSIGQIKIYNLSASNESKMVMYAEKITIEAGYEGSYGLIYQGDVVQCIRYKEGKTDFVLEILACDGDRFTHEFYASNTINRGQTMRQAVDSLMEGTETTFSLSRDLDAKLQQKYIRGKCIFGTPYEGLQVIAKSVNASTYIEDGIVNLAQVSGLPEGEILKLDYSSGLLNMPSQSGYNVTFTALLNPKIKLNTLVQIDNTYIQEEAYSLGTTAGEIEKPWSLDKQGIYRVITTKFSGDTRGSAWEVECDAVSQSGSLPTILQNIISNVN